VSWSIKRRTVVVAVAVEDEAAVVVDAEEVEGPRSPV
jgi:hypothetical protein